MFQGVVMRKRYRKLLLWQGTLRQRTVTQSALGLTLGQRGENLFLPCLYENSVFCQKQSIKDADYSLTGDVRLNMSDSLTSGAALASRLAVASTATAVRRWALKSDSDTRRSLL